MKLTTIVEWNGIVNSEFNIGKLLSTNFHTNVLILTNGNNTICYDCKKDKIKIYRKPGTMILFKRVEELIGKLSRVGLVLNEQYKKEKQAVKQVFGQNFNLHYIMGK